MTDEAIYVAPEELGRAAIRYFALAIGDDNPLYTDDEYARAHGHPSVIAPPTLVCETNQYMHRPRDDHGYIGHTWDLPIQGRLVRGGNSYDFVRPVLPTDRVTARWRIAEIRERDTKTFVVSEVTYTNQDGDLLATNRETNVYVR